MKWADEIEEEWTPSPSERDQERIDLLRRLASHQPESQQSSAACTCDAASDKPSTRWHQTDCPLFDPESQQEGRGGRRLPPQRNAEGGLTTFGLYVASLRWALRYVDNLKPKRFRPDERPPSGIDDDWAEWAAARDLLKDADAALDLQGESDG